MPPSCHHAIFLYLNLFYYKIMHAVKKMWLELPRLPLLRSSLLDVEGESVLEIISWNGYIGNILPFILLTGIIFVGL